MNELARVVKRELEGGGGSMYGDTSGFHERAAEWWGNEARAPIGFRA